MNLSDSSLKESDVQENEKDLPNQSVYKCLKKTSEFVSSFSIDYSIKGTAKCQVCKKVIVKGELRIGKTKLFHKKEILQSYHIGCAFTMFRSARILTSVIYDENEVKGFDLLPTIDKQRLRDEIAAIQCVIDEINMRATVDKKNNS